MSSTEAWANSNGKVIPISQLHVPVYDGGFIQGVTVAEQLRTFQGKLFEVDSHLARLKNSLAIIGVELSCPFADLKKQAEELVGLNYPLLQTGQDLGLCIFVSPGAYRPMATGYGITDPELLGPRYSMHTFCLPFATFGHLYRSGQKLVVSSYREIPNACWPSALKCRSRMHYYLADREARLKDPEARALLLDTRGFVSEASTASLFYYTKKEGLIAPSEIDVLPSITLQVLKKIAAKYKIPFRHRPIILEEMLRADEVFACSTSPSIWPVVSIDGKQIGVQIPGPICQQLTEGFKLLAGFDFVAQAEHWASQK